MWLLSSALEDSLASKVLRVRVWGLSLGPWAVGLTLLDGRGGGAADRQAQLVANVASSRKSG